AVAFQEFLLPVLNQKGTEVDESKIKHRTLPHLQKRSQIWYRGKEGGASESRMYHVELLDPASLEMSGTSVLELDHDFGIHRRWDSRVMRWRESDQSWELRDGVLREFEGGRPDRVQAYRELPLRLPERFADFAQVPRAPDVMNYFELRD